MKALFVLFFTIVSSLASASYVDEYLWKLESGGVTEKEKLCNMVTTELYDDAGTMTEFSAHFLSPCSSAKSTSGTCFSAQNCDVVIEGVLYSLYFDNNWRMTLVRQTDFLPAVYFGEYY